MIPPDQMINAAAEFALKAHDGQTRRDKKTPYVTHLLDVVTHLQRRGVTHVEILAAAWLHDVVEDTSYTLKNIEDAGFSRWVVYLVDTLTRRKGEPYHDFIVRVSASPTASSIKLSDLICNLHDNPSDDQVRRYFAAADILIPKVLLSNTIKQEETLSK